jgi:transposase
LKDKKTKINSSEKNFGSFLGGNIDIRKTDSGLYAARSKFTREGNTVKRTGYEYLGKVIDLEKGIFYSKRLGQFKFTLEDGYQILQASTAITNPSQIEKFILDFGGIWIFDQILQKTNLVEVIDNIIPKDKDNLKTLLAFTLLHPERPFSMAETWFVDSFARILYPDALPKSQNIAKFLQRLGDDLVLDNMFKLYLSYIQHTQLATDISKIPVLIDSTGVTDNIKVPNILINNHNAKINNEFRLIYVVDQISGLPIYFRHIAGNTDDISTLGNTIKELSLCNIDIQSVILDAGYYSSNNIRYICELNIPFVLRMSGNRKQFKELIYEHGRKLRRFENVAEYGDRILYIKKVPIKLEDKYDAFAFVCLDPISLCQEDTNGIKRAIHNKTKHSKLKDQMKFHGKFILVSRNDFEIDQILALYYTRQTVEQILDKNIASNLPVGVHSEISLNSCLLLSFLAAVISSKINFELKGSDISPQNAFFVMDKLKIKIFESNNVILEPTKFQKEILQILKIDLPFPIQSNTNGINCEKIVKKRGHTKKI